MALPEPLLGNTKNSWFCDTVSESTNDPGPGIADPATPVPSASAETTEQLFDQVVDVNFKAAFFTVQDALPHFSTEPS